MSEKELHEKMMIYKTLESRLEVLTRQRELIGSKIAEIASTIESINEISKNNENTLFKLGGEAYVHGNITDKGRILVDIGAGIILEKSSEEGIKTLDGRKKELESTMNEIQTNISQLSAAMNHLGTEINELIKKPQSSTN